MKKRDASTKSGWRLDYYRLNSSTAAYAVATLLRYDKASVREFSESMVHQVQDRVEEIEAGWLLACSPLVQKPILTIALGVFGGLVFFLILMIGIGFMTGSVV